MVGKESDKTNNQILNPALAAKTGYYARTARPIYALMFLLPFIVLYEILVLVINPQILNAPADNVRGGVVAFVWIQNFLQYVCQYVGLNAKNSWLCVPLVIIITLLVLQILLM